MNEEKEITKEEFQEIIKKKFFSWTSNNPKTLDSWLLSLEEWIQSVSSQQSLQFYNDYYLKDSSSNQDDYYIIYTDGKNTAKDGFPTYQDAKTYMDKELQVGGVFEGMTPNELEIHKK
jgi:hypothetical protein